MKKVKIRDLVNECIDNNSKIKRILELKEENKTYPGAEFMLKMLIYEYNYEEDRKRSLDSRSGVFLAFTGTLLVLIPNFLKTPELSAVTQNLKEIILFLLAFLSYIGEFVALIITIFKFVSAINVHDYKRLDYVSFNEENTQYQNDEIAKIMIDEYRDNVTHNKAENDKKLFKFKIGILFLQIALILSVVNYLIFQFFLK